MPRLNSRSVLPVLILLAIVSAASAQNRSRQRDSRTGPTSPPHNPEHGDDVGQITASKFFSTQGKKAGMLDIAVGRGRHMSFNLSETVPIDVESTSVSNTAARSFLVNGTRVRVRWTDARDSRYESGKWADTITIMTQTIEGKLGSMTERGATVTAVPKKDPQMEQAQQPPPIRVNGRPAPKQETRKAPPPPKPRQMKLVFRPQATSFTLDGKSCKAAEILPMMKDHKNMGIEAVLLSGNSNIAVEFHVRSEPTAKEEGNQKAAKASK